MWVVINCENTDGGMSFLLDRGGRKRRCRGFLYYFVPSAGRGLFDNTNLSFPFTSLPRADSAPLPKCVRERDLFIENAGHMAAAVYSGCEVRLTEVVLVGRLYLESAALVADGVH